MKELLWFASRGSGLVAVVLLTSVMCLGMVTSGRRRPEGPSATVVMGLHRSLSLGAEAFLAAHVATAVAETYVSIDLVSALVPFTSGYERIWVGLGTLAVDLLVALVVTSVLRQRIPERLWRAVHVLAFAFWPIAIAHGVALGTADEPVLRGITLSCAVAGMLALAWRLWAQDPDTHRRQAVEAQEWT